MKSLTLGQIKLKSNCTLAQDTEWQNLMLNLVSVSLASYKVESLVLPGAAMRNQGLLRGDNDPTKLFSNVPVVLDVNSEVAYVVVSGEQPLAVALDATEVPKTKTINISEGLCCGQAH